MSTGQIEVISRVLIRRGDLILVCRNLKRGYCYLPGGHIEFGESGAAACKREMQEETGISCEVAPTPALTYECTFEQRGKNVHEVGLVYWAHIDTSIEVYSKEPKIGFEWVAVGALEVSDFRPNAILRWIASGGAEKWITNIQ